jgi:short-subunit dehydrogenase
MSIQGLADPAAVLITGATGGIGSALARHYAQPQRLLVLQGRDPERLEALARGCRDRGAEVRTAALDLRDQQAVRNWLDALLGEMPVDLAILNAGVTSNVRRGPDGESWEDVERVIDVNLRAALLAVDRLLPAMRRRGRGQIALISSLSAYHGLGLTPAYCASKAALKAYGEALRGWLEPRGIAVNVVLPGFVRSAMSDDFPGPRPFMLQPEDAARRIVRGLARNRARISFPFPLNLGMWALALLPPALATRLLRALGYGG